ncbi:MAG: protein translocase SEC61 complex subunit gamma [Desulfurococcales archaeon ex4484_204]|nr:MAG: protein translocase SEC61 complex subunit gamma [Desulfurococcales archaeon ex4484_204]
MRLRELLESWRKILMIAERPEVDEYKLLLKITLGGIVFVGAVGFLILFLMTVVQGGGGG